MRIVFVTSMDAPYRRPVWEAMAHSSELEVWTLNASTDASVKASNRNDDWIRRDSYNYRILTVPTRIIRRGEREIYFIRRGIPPLPIDGTVILGGWDAPAYWLIRYRAKRRGLRVIGFYESHSLSQRHRTPPISSARKLWFRTLDAVVVPGIASAESLIQDGVSTQKIHVGFNAVDVERFHAARADRENRTGPHRFIYVGQLIERKYVELAISALAGLDHTSTLTIVGTGDRRAELEALATELGVMKRVRFLGDVSQTKLPEVLQHADTLLLTSKTEVWGLVVNEALAAGLHVVVSSRAGVAPSVRGMEGVWIADPNYVSFVTSMKASISCYTGGIDKPEILQHDPQTFARTFLEAASIE